MRLRTARSTPSSRSDRGYKETDAISKREEGGVSSSPSSLPLAKRNSQGLRLLRKEEGTGPAKILTY